MPAATPVPGLDLSDLAGRVNVPAGKPVTQPGDAAGVGVWPVALLPWLALLSSGASYPRVTPSGDGEGSA